MLLGSAGDARAHGFFLTPSLPIPVWLFAAAATAVIVISFVALGRLWSVPVLEQSHWRPLGQPSNHALRRSGEVLGGCFGVAVLVAVIVAGLRGEQSPDDNLATVVVFSLFWVGVPIVSVLLGDVFAAINPWRAIGRALGWVGRRFAGGTTPLALSSYPRWLGYIPAAATLLAFGWLELVSTRSPHAVAIAALVYTVLTTVGMVCFGARTWCERAEGFGIYFNLCSRVSALERRGGQIGVRRPLSALRKVSQHPGLVLLMAVLIGTVTYDGASGSAALQSILARLASRAGQLGLNPLHAGQAAATVELLLSVAVIYGAYCLGVAGARRWAADPPSAAPGRAFAVSLMPIALAYTFAHYLGFLLFSSQLLVPRLSDPLGTGRDYFGTAGVEPVTAPLSATTLWYFEVGAIVVGHVAALSLAHDIALSLYGRTRAAMRSQVPMLAVMVSFTVLALWLLKEASEL